MDDKKEYLGDSVYAFVDGRLGVWLITDNGYGAINRIFLDDDTYYALKLYWKKNFEKESE
jgi:hypothetical protein